MTDENIRDRIKPGDRVKLRCGAVLEVAEEDGHLFLSGIYLPQWTTDGRKSAVRETALDIVGILPRPLTDAERLAKIAALSNIVKSDGSMLTAGVDLTGCLREIHDLAAPPTHLDPGREVTMDEWTAAALDAGSRGCEVATHIVRNRLAEAKAARHE